MGKTIPMDAQGGESLPNYAKYAKCHHIMHKNLAHNFTQKFAKNVYKKVTQT